MPIPWDWEFSGETPTDHFARTFRVRPRPYLSTMLTPPQHICYLYPWEVPGKNMTCSVHTPVHARRENLRRQPFGRQVGSSTGALDWLSSGASNVKGGRRTQHNEKDAPAGGGVTILAYMFTGTSLNRDLS